jgi:hypothetical protein
MINPKYKAEPWFADSTYPVGRKASIMTITRTACGESFALSGLYTCGILHHV